MYADTRVYFLYDMASHKCSEDLRRPQTTKLDPRFLPHSGGGVEMSFKYGRHARTTGIRRATECNSVWASVGCYAAFGFDPHSS